MTSCIWIWVTTGWGEDPAYPHSCPPGTHCNQPGYDGAYYGERAEVVGPCAPD